jgi:viroplasmin and RNaseH domain-containing protein
MPKKKSHYAVRKGRKPGIFTHWFGIGGAHEQIDEFPNAQFKGFYSKSEAEAWLNSSGAVLKHYNRLVDKLVNGDESVLLELTKLGSQLNSPTEKAPWED